jgi:hypothetical protein
LGTSQRWLKKTYPGERTLQVKNWLYEKGKQITKLSEEEQIIPLVETTPFMTKSVHMCVSVCI